MYSYHVEFKNGKTLFTTNHKIEGENVWLFDFMRKGTKYSLDEIGKIIESKMYMGNKTEKIIFENKVEQNCLPSLNEVDQKILASVKEDMEQWRNKIFKVELDYSNKRIKVISKRKTMKEEGFAISLFKEFMDLTEPELEKFIFNKYTTSVYMNC